jgi:aromatic ring-opening dioxygenase LigB subunit
MTQSAVDGYYEAPLSWCVLPLYFVRERRIGGMSNSSSSYSPLSIIFEERPEIRSFFCLVGILCV